jgi:transcriptional regulator of acetoin/glycerol metabolism
MSDTIATLQPLSPLPSSAAELERRRAANAELIELARPHLEWLSAAHQGVPHVVSLVDGDGVVLLSLAKQLDAARSARLPGMGAPVQLPDGATIGAIKLQVAPDADSASRLLVVAHAAFTISQELKRRAQSRARAA